jgi:hypothetical protein
MRLRRLLSLLRPGLLGALGLAGLVWGARPAAAAQPLVQAYEVAASELQVWWKERDLMVVTPGLDGLEARRPLVDTAVHAAPSGFRGWTRLGEACGTKSSNRTTFSLAGKLAVVAAGGDSAVPVVTIHRDGVLVAQAPLGQPAKACAVHVGEADALPGVEIVVSWILGSIQGVTVFRLPELAH